MAGSDETTSAGRGEDAAWDSHLARFPEATFYHTRTWARIVTRAFPGLEDRSRWLDIGRGRVALPLYGWRRLGGLLTTLQSGFPFLYGGPIPRLVSDRDAVPDVVRSLSRGGESFLVIPSPFGATPGGEGPDGRTDLAEDPAGWETPRRVQVESDSTQAFRLPSRFEEYWEKTLTTAKRNDVRRLAKKGVSIRRGQGRDDIAAVYRFYRASFSRWGGRPGFVYPEEMYHAMVDLGGENVRLYLAEFEGKIVGGAFVLRWNGRAHYHAGYFDHDARALRPNVLLQERIIRDAIEDGLTEYDMLPSGGNVGVEAFKESFGAVRLPMRRLRYQAPLHRIVDSIRGRRRMS